MKGMNGFYRAGTAFLCAALTLSALSCQKSPDESLVVNKDLDKLIEEAISPDTDKVEIGDLTDKYESYVTSIENESLGVTVNVDAKVDIPQAERLSVFRVEQMEFTQDFVDKVRAELIGDTKMFDGAALSKNTKESLETEIAIWRSMIEESTDEKTRQEYQKKIDSLQNEYENAPDEIDLSLYPSDGKLHTVEEKYQADQNNSYYSWLYGLNAQGDVLYEVSDGTDGQYTSLYVQNCADKSNKLVFKTCGYDYISHDGVMVGGTDITPAKDFWMELPENFLANGLSFEDKVLTPIPGETAELSLEDALSTADEFLEKIGIEEFEYYEGGLFSECMLFKDTKEDEVNYRTYYILRYFRNIDGAFLTQSSGTKRDMGDPQSGNYNKLSWPGECIEFRINDCGIVEFAYNAPLNFIETVVENSALKSFEDVRETFEKMMPVTKASEMMTKVYDIDRVRLSYSRISEADSFDTGLVVPVWDFSGKLEYTFTDEESGMAMDGGTGSVLSINAIDGSIIDSDLGY